MKRGDIMGYEKKSEPEVLREIQEIRRKLSASGVPYDKQIELVKSMMPALNKEQRVRLQKLIELLEKNS